MAGACRGVVLVLALLLDVAGCLLSLVGTHRGSAGGLSLSGEDITTLALLAGRLFGVTLLAATALRCALGRWPHVSGCGCCPAGGGRTSARSRRAVSSEEGGARELPLLEAGGLGLLAEPPSQSPTSAGAALDGAAPRPSGDERARQIDELVSAQSALLKHTKNGQAWRNMLLVASYMFVALCSVRVAAVVVAMDFSSDSTVWAAAGLLTSLFMMNLEFIMLRGWVLDLTAGDAVHMPTVHDHPLYWIDLEGKGYSNCSRCDEKLGAKVGGYLSLQCRKCVPNQWGWGGFQICMQCYRKLAVKQGEGGDKGAGGAGILTGDKGPKVAVKLTVVQYVVRLAALVNLSSTAVCLLCVVGSRIVDTYIPKAQGDCINALVAGSEHDFLQRMQVYVIFVICSSLFGFAKSVCVQTLSTRLYNNMSVRLFQALLSQDIAFYDNAMTGQLNSRLTNDLRQATSPVTIIVNSFIGNTVQLVAGFAICMNASWRLTLLAFTCLSPVIHITREFSQWASALWGAQYTYLADAQGVATQALTNIRTVRAFGATSVELGKYEGHMTKSMRIGLKSAWGQGFATLLSDMAQQSASLIILYYGGHLALGHDNFTVGSIITFSYLWNMLSGAFQGLLDNVNQPVKAMSAGQRVFEILDLQPDIPETVGDAFPIDSAQVRLHLEDISFTYQSRPDKKVLSGVRIYAAPGKTTAIVGKSGCGKSTITKLLLRFYDPQDGRILVNGVSLCSMNVREFRSKIGLVSQDTQLFRCTIFENITYGLDPGTVSQADAERAAVLANADEFIRSLPEGYKTMVGEGGHDLSGGQKQRLSIARALVRRPRLLLLDEATSALDAENEALVQASLDTVMKEMQGTCTIVVIAHRLSTIREADHIIVMHEGEKVEEGTHDELLQKDGRYAALTLRQRQDQAVVQDASPSSDGDKETKTASQTEEEVKRLISALPSDQQGEVLKALFTAFKSSMMKR